jgi:energy-coupling factor transporter ATP-binding protein EcfA2
LSANLLAENNLLGKYLITGRSGSGKSTIFRELNKRGFETYDGDRVPGLSGWTDLKTKQRIEADYPGDDHIGKFTWDWDGKILRDLIGRPGDIFLCGNADNATNFYPLFDKVFILTLEEAEQRPEHDYGKDLTIQDEVIRGQASLVKESLALGAVTIDAMPEADIIVDNILNKLS